MKPKNGTELRDLGIERAAIRSKAWRRQGWLAAVELAKRQAEICSFDIWALLGAWGVEPPPEPRAMGSLLTELRRDGVLAPTGRYLPSPRPEQHRQPCQVWRSLILPAHLAQLPLAL